jgi:hypothetical protein
VVKCRVGTSSLLNQFNTVCIQLQSLSNAANENWVQSQKEKIRKRVPLYLQPTGKRLITRKKRNRACFLEDALKTPLFLEFISKGVTNIDSNHMPLEHYIRQFNAGKIVLFDHDIVPFCGDARENNAGRSIAR